MNGTKIMIRSNKSRRHPVVELIQSQRKTAEWIDRRLGQADLGRTATQAVAGGRAFRDYGVLSNTVGVNKAGNLRGMVLNAKWRMVFTHTSEVGEYMENIGYLASLASGIMESAPKIEAILDSRGSAAMKGLQISAISGSIAQRALLGVVPAGAHLIYRSLEGWCMIAGLAGGPFQSGAAQCIKTLRYADVLVQTSFRVVTDTSNQSKAAWWVIDFFTSPRKK
jgi:hypothetical protein